MGTFSGAGLLCVLGCSGANRSCLLSRPVVDSMNAIFDRSNEHWDELQDLTQLEKMLGTVRPTQARVPWLSHRVARGYVVGGGVDARAKHETAAVRSYG